MRQHISQPCPRPDRGMTPKPTSDVYLSRGTESPQFSRCDASHWYPGSCATLVACRSVSLANVKHACATICQTWKRFEPVRLPLRSSPRATTLCDSLVTEGMAHRRRFVPRGIAIAIEVGAAVHFDIQLHIDNGTTVCLHAVWFAPFSRSWPLALRASTLSVPDRAQGQDVSPPTSRWTRAYGHRTRFHRQGCRAAATQRLGTDSAASAAPDPKGGPMHGV